MGEIKMLNFLRKPWSSSAARRMAHDKLLRKETECQLCINELDRKIERQQQRLQEILERGKRETSEIARLGLAEQYAQGERKVMRLLEQRKTFVQAKEIVEVQLADFELQAAIPQSIFELNRPESQRERALVDVLRSRIKQTHEDMLSSLEGSTLDNQIDNHERASIQAALDLFDRERDEEIRVTLRAIEDDLNLDNTASLFSQPQRARETE
jgi:hypothetical protein